MCVRTPGLHSFVRNVPRPDWDLLLPVQWPAMSAQDQLGWLLRWLPFAEDPMMMELRGRIITDPEGARRSAEMLRAQMGMDLTVQLISEPT